MDNYFVLWEVAQEWKVLTEELVDNARAALEARLNRAGAGVDPIVGLGILLVYVAAVLLWMMI